MQGKFLTIIDKRRIDESGANSLLKQILTNGNSKEIGFVMMLVLKAPDINIFQIRD